MPPPARIAYTKGFTLAEVLITLGIIGVVAALTMPVLIEHHKKQVTTTRLKRFYSTYMQARELSLNEYVDMVGSDILISGKNPEQMLKWYNIYLAPYLLTAEVKKTNVGIEAAFMDGSGMLMAKSGCAAGSSCVHVLYCTELKYCEEDDIINEVEFAGLVDAKNTFLFYTSGVPKAIYDITEDNTDIIENFSREDALRLCKSNKRNCTTLLYMDNWEFKDDYPW